MKQLLWAGLAGLSCLVLMTASVDAKVAFIAPPPLAQRVALVDAIVVGKVTGIGDKLVSAVQPAGGDKVQYQIAIVHVEDALLGAKGAKEIKVGFLAPTDPGPGPRPIRRGPQFNLTLDQEGCLFLVKHPTEDFYVGQNYYDLLPKSDNSDKEQGEIKHYVQLLADPAAGLKAKNADDRFLTAAMLLARYRMQKPGSTKTEPIDAEESKQILLALADADWNPKPAPGPVAFQMNPQTIFLRMGLTEKEGWTQPQDAAAIPDAAKKWLKDNVEKYRVERFVAEKKDGDGKEEKKNDR